MKKKLLIFIVTYKASFRLLKLIQKIPYKKLSNFNYNIYISDDHSEDLSTFRYIKLVKNRYGSKIKVNYNKKNLGYGGNIKKCINYAYKNHYDYAIMLHGDNQYNPKYIGTMLNLISKTNYDAIVGSRMRNREDALKGNMPIYKYLGNIVLSKYFNIFFNTKFTDCHTGYWFYNLMNLPKKYFDNCDENFCFDLDFRLQLVNKSKSIKEIAINTFYGTERSSFHVVYAIRFFYKVLKFRLLKKL